MQNCEACGKAINPTSLRHGELPQEGSVSDEVYGQVVGNLERVIKDLNWRERYGLEVRVKKVHKWFQFHGDQLPAMPHLKNPEDMRTENIYQYVRDLCEHLSTKGFADEIHLEACSANRELSREIVRMNMRF